MPTMAPDRSLMLMVDFQGRLMPAIAEGEAVMANARRLLDAATLLDVPVVFTEQNPAKLGGTVAALQSNHPALPKMGFRAQDAAGFVEARGGRGDIVIAGVEAHVCVLQSVVGFLDDGARVFVVADAIGSRDPASKGAALARMTQLGAELVTTEMVVFEWLGTADHPRFRDAVALIK